MGEAPEIFTARVTQLPTLAEIEETGAEVEVEDDGLCFNPLDAPEPDLTGPIEDRPIGGLGIYLVKNIMDELDYRRREGRNCLFMKKRV